MGTAAAVVAVGGWLLFARGPSLPRELSAVVPADTLGFVHVRVERLMASDAFQRLVLARGEAPGFALVEARCGFNPLTQVRELIAFASPPPEAGEPRYAFVARGQLRHAQLLDCMGKFGRGDSAAHEREEVEGVWTVRSKRGSTRAAFIGGDGLIGGEDQSVRAALRTWRGRARSVAGDPLLAALYRELDADSDITAVARIPSELRPLPRALAEADLPELHGLRAVGANLTTGPGRVAGRALLVASDARQASELAALGKRALARLSGVPGVRLTSLSKTLREVEISAHGDRVRCAASVEVRTVEALLELVPMLERLARASAHGSDAGVVPADADAADAGL